MIRTQPDETSADTNEQASDKSRDASFGIVIAIMMATSFWGALIALYYHLTR